MPTNGERYGPAMRATTEAEADAIVDGLVAELVERQGISRLAAESTIRSDIGYWAGYYDRETFERVMRLFRTEHPILGTTWPTAEEAVAAGRRWAEEATERAQDQGAIAPTLNHTEVQDGG